MSFQYIYRYLHQTVLLLLICFFLPLSASPTYPKYHGRRAEQAQVDQSTSASSLLRRQFTNPSEVLAVLLLIGGDIVQKAIAQMCGSTITPVAFSFGWVSYAFSSLMSAFGDGVLMPDPDFSTSIIDIGSGVRKQNSSWIVSRLIRDLEKEAWNSMNKTWIDEKGIKCREDDSSLFITVYEAESGAGITKWDWLSRTYFVTLLLQLVIAAVPIIVDRNWSIMLITAAGSLLALITGSLPEWKKEKFACRKNKNGSFMLTKASYALTRGNGHPHVFVIQTPWLSNGERELKNLYLEDLAGNVRAGDHPTRIITVILAVLWILLLITVGSINVDTWYLLGIGALGMAQNVTVAGFSRHSAAHGFPIHIVSEDHARGIPDGRRLGRRREGSERQGVMKVLYDAEEAYPGLGLSLKELFFPIGTRPRGDETVKWDSYVKSLEDRKERRKDEIRTKFSHSN